MGNDECQSVFKTEVSKAEWDQVNRLRSAVGDDERHFTGRIHLSCDGTRRIWEASNSFRALRYVGGDDTGVYRISLPPLIASFALIAASNDGETTLESEVREDGAGLVTVRGEGGVTTFDPLWGEVPDFSEFFRRTDGIAEATFDIQSFRFLWSLIGIHRDQRTQHYRPSPEEVNLIPVTLSVRDGFVAAQTYHEELGLQTSTVPAVTTGVIASRSMSHDNLKAALEGIEMLIAFGSDAAGLEAPFHVTVVMPETEDAPVQFFGRDSAAVVKPRPSRARLAQDHVEAVIRECFDTVAAERDADGDYPLFRHRVPVFGRLDLSSDPLWLQVYTVLLSNIERTPELLEELNDLNQHMSFAPLYHQVTEDGVGQVVSEIDLLAETLDPAELHTAVQRIHELAINITPTLAAVFGGDVAADPAEVRWLSYGDTVVEAELVPETLTALTGAEGIEPWPFPGPVYVITGWNPQGVSLGEARHRGVNQRIADDVVGRGGRYVLGVGRDPDGSHAEPSIVAWRIGRADAIEMGTKANQDAIFEIDADEIRLLSCHDGRVEARPRRGT